MSRDRIGNRGRGRTAMSRGAALLVLGMLAAAPACTRTGAENATGEARPPLAVRAQAVDLADWEDTRDVTAGVQAFRRATPGTILVGRVDRVLKQEGDLVRSGEPLALVESREVTARLAQAEAQVAAAKAGEENARRTRERMERLYERQAVPRKTVDDTVAAHEAALAQLAAAEQGVNAAKMYVGYSRVISPFDGVVVEKRVEQGDTAAPGLPLFVVEDVSRVKIEAVVPESALAGLSAGTPVTIDIPSLGGEPRRGTLAEILPSADPASRTVGVRAVLDNPGHAIRSGTYARLRLPGPPARIVAVPASALVRQGPLTGLFVVDGRAARLRWVTVGRERDGRIEVLTGLRPGERIVIDPPEDLEDGRAVEVRG